MIIPYELTLIYGYNPPSWPSKIPGTTQQPGRPAFGPTATFKGSTQRLLRSGELQVMGFSEQEETMVEYNYFARRLSNKIE